MENPRTAMKTLAMAIMYTCTKTSIKSFSHVANITTSTNIPLKYVHDARNIVIESEEKNTNHVTSRGRFWA